jgi:hypothetical protein
MRPEKIIATPRYEAVMPMSGAVDGLRGPITSGIIDNYVSQKSYLLLKTECDPSAASDEISRTGSFPSLEYLVAASGLTHSS